MLHIFSRFFSRKNRVPLKKVSVCWEVVKSLKLEEQHSSVLLWVGVVWNATDVSQSSCVPYYVRRKRTVNAWLLALDAKRVILRTWRANLDFRSPMTLVFLVSMCTRVSMSAACVWFRVMVEQDGPNNLVFRDETNSVSCLVEGDRTVHVFYWD